MQIFSSMYAQLQLSLIQTVIMVMAMRQKIENCSMFNSVLTGQKNMKEDKYCIKIFSPFLHLCGLDELQEACYCFDCRRREWKRAPLGMYDSARSTRYSSSH